MKCIFVSELGNFEPKTKVSVKGPGEDGLPYHMPQERANDIADSESKYGMNIAASDDIALNRYMLNSSIKLIDVCDNCLFYCLAVVYILCIVSQK